MAAREIEYNKIIAKQLSHISLNVTIQRTHNEGLLMDNSIVLR